MQCLSKQILKPADSYFKGIPFKQLLSIIPLFKQESTFFKLNLEVEYDILVISSLTFLHERILFFFIFCIVYLFVDLKVFIESEKEKK